MQEEVDEKVIGLCVTGGQISGEILKSALSHTLNQISKFHEKDRVVSSSLTLPTKITAWT